MKNPTVKKLIEVLQKMDENAIVCFLELENDEMEFETIEMCKEFKNVEYVSDNGDIISGDVVALY